VKQVSQLLPVKLNLRFILALLMNGETIFAEVPELDILTTLPACKTVAAALENRQVGSGRTHAILYLFNATLEFKWFRRLTVEPEILILFLSDALCARLNSLLIKKVLVFLSSRESVLRRQFLPPTTYESYMYVDSICSDSSHRRRQETRNRALLGIQTSKMLHKSQPVRHLEPLSTDAFAMPSMFGNARPSSGAAASAQSTLALRNSPPPVAQKLPLSNVTAVTDAAELDLSPNELTHEELKAVASGSLAYLQQREPAFYVHHLVTATLCLGLAPRSQLLKQLRLGSSFVKEADGRWWIRMVGEVMKNGKPTVIALPKQLTEPYDYYFATIRPVLLRQQKGVEGGESHDYVFFKKNGSAPRTDFTDFTTIATTQLVGRAINPHAFRAAVVTAFYETGATQSDMDILANIMCHDTATARAYYHRPKMAKAAVDTGDRMIHALDISTSPLAAVETITESANGPAAAAASEWPHLITLILRFSVDGGKPLSFLLRSSFSLSRFWTFHSLLARSKDAALYSVRCVDPQTLFIFAHSWLHSMVWYASVNARDALCYWGAKWEGYSICSEYFFSFLMVRVAVIQAVWVRRLSVKCALLPLTWLCFIATLWGREVLLYGLRNRMGQLHW
jgi:hypothetical protein